LTLHPPLHKLSNGNADIEQRSDDRCCDHRRGDDGKHTMTTDVTMTERAARRIGEILRGEPAGAMLRVSVEGGGCSGFQYKFDFDSAQALDDLVLARDGATVLIDPVSVQYMAGAEIDYVEDLIGASFKIKNPVATASCGCGTSFSV
jgi:iron-sulfur cluster assembly accessory protein